MIWVVITLFALAIPLAAVVLDSPVMRAWAGRRHGEVGDGAPDTAGIRRLEEKVSALETELEAAHRDIAQLKESQQFFQRLLEDPAARQAAAKQLPKPNP